MEKMGQKFEGMRKTINLLRKSAARNLQFSHFNDTPMRDSETFVCVWAYKSLEALWDCADEMTGEVLEFNFINHCLENSSKNSREIR
jgi:hypothetical protein